MPALDEDARDRELRDAIATLKLPPLAADTFARIVARRASGERVVLRTADVVAARRYSRSQLIGGAMAAVAALVMAAVLSQRDPAVTGASLPDRFALAPVDSACANFAASRDSSALHHLMISAFGVSVACGAEVPPDAPITVDPSRILPGQYTYGGISITDGVFTSVHKPVTITISRARWHDSPALLAVREGPLLTGVHLDSLTVSMRNLTPLHFASWYPTQHPVGSLHADFDSSMVTIVMGGRFDTVATFSYPTKPGELPFGWTEELVVPALALAEGWHGTVQIALPIHPHAFKLLGKPWESMSLRVIGREKIRVAAGSFECWKVQVGEPENMSFLWVGTRNHLVIRSQTTHRFGATSFEDRVDLLRMILTAE